MPTFPPDDVNAKLIRLQSKVEHIDGEVQRIRTFMNERMPPDGFLERMQEISDRQDALLRQIDRNVVGLKDRQDDHTGRITILEGSTQKQTMWSSRASGMWAGIALAITAASSVAALIHSFLK